MCCEKWRNMEFSHRFDFIRFAWNRLRQRLWVRPMGMCVLSVLGVFVASLLDGTGLTEILPAITPEAVVALLTIMTASMLVIATFAVGAMVSAYASASGVATPRSFALVIADDVSQNALSTFVGAFIFSTVALVALKSNCFESAGLFAVFVMAVAAFALVILMFVRWVDNIARLGRLGETIEKVERATAAALMRRRDAPTLHALPREAKQPTGQPVFSETVGYVQYIDVAGLQAWAEEAEVSITVESLPGAFVAPNRPLAYITSPPTNETEADIDQAARYFTIGSQRMFEDDPRFGFIVLSQIATRSLSPGINDPGTAIDVIGALVRLFVLWGRPSASEDDQKPKYDRVEIPAIEARELFDDAFPATSRDGAGIVEVAVRLQKAFQSLAAFGDTEMRDAAMHYARQALAHAEMALKLPDDLAAVRAVADTTASGEIPHMAHQLSADKPV